MGWERPPQTVGEALDGGWTALALTCANPRCRHAGRVDLAALPARRRAESLALLASLCPCSRCGGAPSVVQLALPVPTGEGGVHWHCKRIEIDEGRVVRPSRE